MADLLADAARSPPTIPHPTGPRLTRRRLLGLGLGGAAALAGAGFGVEELLAGGGPGPPAPNGTPLRFVSRPDLEPTVSRLTTSGPRSPGLMFLGPDRSDPVQPGAMARDARGELVWSKPTAGRVAHVAWRARAHLVGGCGERRRRRRRGGGRRHVLPVAGWTVLGGSRAGELRAVAHARRAGFETAVGVGTGEGVLRAVAHDAAGRTLGSSALVRI